MKQALLDTPRSATAIKRRPDSERAILVPSIRATMRCDN